MEVSKEEQDDRCPGPNATWHIDGYDKLTLFGFGISGCIDGYSRRIIFLQVCHSDHDSHLIAAGQYREVGWGVVNNTQGVSI